MKSVLVNGTRLDLDDRVAGVLVDYALALTDRGMHAAATVPIRVDGRSTSATLSLGCPAVWVVVDGADEGELPGSAEAAAELEARLSHLLQRSVTTVRPAPSAPSVPIDSALDWLDFA